MTKKHTTKGFTLVEIAVVIVIMGLMAALILPGIFRTIERNKLERGRAGVLALKNEVIGFVVENNMLPADLTTFSGRVDQWGKDVWYHPGLEDTDDICSVTSTQLSIQKTATGPIIGNIAFVLVSSGKNMNFETTTVTVPPLPYTVRYYDQGTQVGQYEFDDIVEYVSLAELKGKACR